MSLSQAHACFPDSGASLGFLTQVCITWAGRLLPWAMVGLVRGKGRHLLKPDLVSSKDPPSVSQSVKQSAQDLGHPGYAQGVALLPRTIHRQGA